MNISDGFFDLVYRGTAPWDIGAPQPDMVALLDEFPPTGPALDVGCGSGNLTLALARRGLQVIGVDLTDRAIAQAREKLAAEPPDVRLRVEFRLADALQLDPAPGSFNTVVDSGFYHLFGKQARETFVKKLTALLSPGGRYYLLEIAFDVPIPSAPRKVTESELRETFSAERGWRVLAVRPGRFLANVRRMEIPAVAACVEKLAGAF